MGASGNRKTVKTHSRHVHYKRNERAKHAMHRKKHRIDPVLRWFISAFGIIMLAEASVLYIVTDSLRPYISPSLLAASLAYIFLRIVVAFIFIAYSSFYTESRK